MSNEEFNATLISSTKTLRPFALHLTKSGNDADDLIQEMVFRALKCREKLVEDSNMIAWLYTILKNLFINNYRRNKKIKELIDNNDFGTGYFATKNAINDGESNIECLKINTELNKLSGSYSKPLLMYFKGYKYEEIAEDLNLPIGTVKSRIHIARKLMQKKFENETKYIN